MGGDKLILQSSHGYTQELRERILLTVMERIEEANLQDRRVTWADVTADLRLDGHELHPATIRKWFHSEWGMQLRKEWAAVDRADAAATLMGIFNRGIGKLAEIVDTGSHRQVLDAMKVLRPYFEEAGLAKSVAPTHVGSMHILIQQYQGETTIRHEDDPPIDAEVRVLDSGESGVGGGGALSGEDPAPVGVSQIVQGDSGVVAG